MALKIFNKTKVSDLQNAFAEEEANVQLYLRMSVSSEDGEYTKVDTVESSNKGEYILSYNYWRSNTIMRSSNNFDDDYFRNIAYRRDDFLPFITKDLQDGNLSMLRILERIFPEKCPYSGYIAPKLARKKWLRILK